MCVCVCEDTCNLFIVCVSVCDQVPRAAGGACVEEFQFGDRAGDISCTSGSLWQRQVDHRRTLATLLRSRGASLSFITRSVECFFECVLCVCVCDVCVVQEGCVLLDGVDIRSYNVHWLRSCMGLVSQEPALFADTIHYNIAYGKPQLELEENHFDSRGFVVPFSDREEVRPQGPRLFALVLLLCVFVWFVCAAVR